MSMAKNRKKGAVLHFLLITSGLIDLSAAEIYTIASEMLETYTPPKESSFTLPTMNVVKESKNFSRLAEKAVKSENATENVENPAIVSVKRRQKDLYKLLEAKAYADSAHVIYNSLYREVADACLKRFELLKEYHENFKKASNMEKIANDYYLTYSNRAYLPVEACIDYSEKANMLEVFSSKIKELTKSNEVSIHECRSQRALVLQTKELNNISRRHHIDYLFNVAELQKKFIVLMKKELSLIKCVAAKEKLLYSMRKAETAHAQATSNELEALQMVIGVHLQHIKYMDASIALLDDACTLQQDLILKAIQRMDMYILYYAAVSMYEKKGENTPLCKSEFSGQANPI
ncbi:hypothetical protein NEAUS04_0030 [Nematocida ausubeli]|uniref:Uncharacterized protein n=1 Tax=Nematocida ausubeli (strain ATCC PRA-371 / ERTm2) TaxID=1913371 RepID=A0A086IZY6_NEMA1|nr:uncharacterized protein NESG_02229 [Nematocida ausubeli]KAI5132824.1 hypothetical protein NEAUS06_0370 [Nematocida ausubeli]KAI5147141.1 hypothetical protein NEAUS05_0466 [Nematocida ausubeli]KAI5160496.1 hypothetical protein NEAUS04_0030 [Nematocida ausubeli]KFG25454.1 hypothetical protein NESG_02229 [Nematocida ausubeli]